jgi:hypothetical protein
MFSYAAPLLRIVMRRAPSAPADAVSRSASTRWLSRAISVATGLAFGFGVGAAADVGASGAIVAAFVFPMLLVGLARRIARDDWQVAQLALFAFALRVAAGAGLFAWSVWDGRGGFITGDDRAYSQLAWAYAQWLHGAPDPSLVPPNWGGSSHLFGTFVYMTVPIYYLVGLRPLLIGVMNAGLAAAAMVFIWDIAQRAFGRRSGNLTMLILAIAPANVLFSALVLKDATALLITTLVLWSAFRFQERPAWRWIFVAAVSITLMNSTRGYASFALFAVFLVAVLLSRRLASTARWAWLATSGIACGGALIVALTGGGGSVPAYTLSGLEQIRQGMAQGANTAFVPIMKSNVADQPARPGDSTSMSDVTPRALSTVPPLTVEETPIPTIARTLAALAVLFLLAWLASKLAARPVAAAVILALTAVFFLVIVYSRLPQLALAGPAEGAALVRTLTYLPQGFSNVILAPYPWAVRRLIDLPTVPDAILGYIALAAAAATLVARADLRRVLAPIAAYIVGTLVILVLSEGNVGTVFRHRTMSVTPFVIMLAAPSLVLCGGWLRRLWRTPAGRGGT